jgi:hypothetical protein
MAADSLPLNPELTFQHISVHCLNILAQYIAREKVKARNYALMGHCDTLGQGRSMKRQRPISMIIPSAGERR